MFDRVTRTPLVLCSAAAMMVLIAPKAQRPPTSVPAIVSTDEGLVADTVTVWGPLLLSGGGAAPKNYVEVLSVGDAGGQPALLVLESLPDAPRATRITVHLNGVELLAAQGDALANAITRAVDLRGADTLRVAVAGEMGSRATLSVRRIANDRFTLAGPFLLQSRADGIASLDTALVLPSGIYWRVNITPITSILRSHGAMARGFAELSANYTTGMDTAYFDWSDARHDTARDLAQKFVLRFPEVVRGGQGRDWLYAGWYVEVLGLAERGILPVAYADGDDPPSGLLSTTDPAVFLPSHHRAKQSSQRRGVDARDVLKSTRTVL